MPFETAPSIRLIASMSAFFVFARVISAPTAESITCDAGSKSVAAEAGDPCAAAIGHPQLVARGFLEEVEHRVAIQPRQALGGHAVPAPQVTPVRHRQPEVVEGASLRVDQGGRRCHGPGGRLTLGLHVFLPNGS